MGELLVAKESEEILNVIKDTRLYDINREMHIYPFTHSIRVAQLGRELALVRGLSEEESRIIEVAGIGHDSEKFHWPDWLFTKENPSDEDWKIIIRHPTESKKIFEEYLFRAISYDNSPMRKAAGEAIGDHHQRFDGIMTGDYKGYNKMIKGEEISLGGRILKTVDAFDVMTHKRPYRFKVFTIEEAREEIKKDIGTQYCPECAEAFLSIPISKLEKICESI